MEFMNSSFAACRNHIVKGNYYKEALEKYLENSSKLWKDLEDARQVKV